MNFSHWINHFRNNQSQRPEPDWESASTLHKQLSPRQFAMLVRSLQQFQLGDGGGPAYLIARDRAGVLSGSGNIKVLVDLWFKEEEEHSRLLGCALRRLGAPEIQSHWSFSLFCGLRKWLGVQFELYALLLTEIVSHQYYKLLRRHCADVAIRGMCDLINRDEAGHIAFHRARLTSEGVRHQRHYGRLWELQFRMRGLAAGTVLWVNHRGALVGMGATDRAFYRAIWRGMGRFIAGLRADLAWEMASRRLTPKGHQPQTESDEPGDVPPDLKRGIDLCGIRGAGKVAHRHL